MGRSEGSGNCMVCGDDEWVGIWRDPEGFTLRACGRIECVRGYEFVISAVDWFKAHWGPHSGGNAMRRHVAAMTNVRARKAARQARVSVPGNSTMTERADGSTG